MKFKDWLNIWLENYVKPGAKARTAECYSHIITKLIDDEIGEIELENLTALHIQEFVTRLLNRGNMRTRLGLAPSTVNTVITVIQSSLKPAVALGYIKKDAVTGVRRPKIKGKEVSCFTLREQKKIERAVLGDKRAKMFGIILCLYTGLRIGELLALTWNDVDLQKGLISVTKTCRNGAPNSDCTQLCDEPKTESSRRIIPLPKQLLPAMRELKRTSRYDYVISHRGHPLTIRSYQRSFELLLSKLRIPRKGFHSLRHTFATRALECGMDVKTLAELLGHKNATVTLNRYAHSLIEHKKDMMNKLGKLFPT